MLMMKTDTDYAYSEGFSRGVRAGEYDRAEGLGTMHDTLADQRERAAMALTRSQRAYFLGYVRGYREAARTYRWGRWGT